MHPRGLANERCTAVWQMRCLDACLSTPDLDADTHSNASIKRPPGLHYAAAPAVNSGERNAREI